jgi:signal transduction histidine kinase
MPAAPGRLRIAVIGPAGAEAAWAGQLDGHEVEVVSAGDLRELDGQEVHVAVFTSRAGGEGVKLVRALLEGRREREGLQRAARLADIGQLAAGVAHEINTPLASIALRAESLLKSADDPRLTAVESFKNFPRYLKTIEEEIYRCKRIIGALLDFSRARRPEVRDTDLNALAEKAKDLVGHRMRQKQVELGLALDPALPRVSADDGQIRQVVLALLINALDATEPGGKVTLGTAREPDGRVALTVADTGTGISPENLDKLFTPFFTTKPVGQGTGLGLSTCHGIVAEHGGEIRVDSAPGAGTRMTVVLDAARAAEAP